MEEIINNIQDPQVKKDLKKIISFHGFLSSGVIIGYQMLNIAKKQLDINEDENVYVTSETFSCIPDPFQILWGSTIGSKRLIVKDYDKMAVTVNKGSRKDQKYVKGIRIFLDSKKTEKYPLLHDWYMNYKKVPHEEVIPILIAAGERIYTWTFVDVEVPHKKRKNVLNCQVCGESFVSWDKSKICIPCKNMNKKF